MVEEDEDEDEDGFAVTNARAAVWSCFFFFFEMRWCFGIGVVRGWKGRNARRRARSLGPTV